MALANPAKHLSLLADKTGNPILTNQSATIVELTDSTTGTASDTLNDSTVSVKDDLASLAGKVNEIIVILAAQGIIADA
jgi:hypothetical protein